VEVSHDQERSPPNVSNVQLSRAMSAAFVCS
jgi:hypothetical protein